VRRGESSFAFDFFARSHSSFASRERSTASHRTFLCLSLSLSGHRAAVMPPRRQRGWWRSAARGQLFPSAAAAFMVVAFVAFALVAISSSTVASAQATTTHASSPPPPFDPAAGWPSSGVRTLDVTLPPAETVEDEEYLCTSVPLPDNTPLGLTRVEPLASAAVVHHILLFGECLNYGNGWERKWV
jgi:hypothetical protein